MTQIDQEGLLNQNLAMNPEAKRKDLGKQCGAQFSLQVFAESHKNGMGMNILFHASFATRNTMNLVNWNHTFATTQKKDHRDAGSRLGYAFHTYSN